MNDPPIADDSFLYRRIRNQQDATALQDDLGGLQRWESDWQMAFNPSRCEVVRISRNRYPIKANYSIHGQDQAKVSSGRYLSVTITGNLTWTLT